MYRSFKLIFAKKLWANPTFIVITNKSELMLSALKIDSYYSPRKIKQ